MSDKQTFIVDVKRVNNSEKGQNNYQLHLMGEVEGPSGIEQSSYSMLLQASNIGDDRFAGRKMAHAWLKITPEAITQVYGKFLSSVNINPSDLEKSMRNLEIGEIIDFNEGEGYPGLYANIKGNEFNVSLQIEEKNRASNTTEQENMYEASTISRPSAKHIVDDEGEIRFFFTQNEDGTVSPIFRNVYPVTGEANNTYLPLIRDEEGRPVTFSLEDVQSNKQNDYSVNTEAVVSKVVKSSKTVKAEY